MSISNISQKIKHASQKVMHFMVKRDVLLVVLLFCSSISSFFLGALSVTSQNKHQPIVFTEVAAALPGKYIEENKKALSGGKTPVSEIFSSKSGTKYYYVWCSGAGRVKAENRVYYKTKEEAESSGKTLAANCSPN